MQTRSPYEVLAISSRATPEEIKQAYRKLARRFHPDVCKEPGAEARMKEINVAYTALLKGSAQTSPPAQNDADWLYEFMRAFNEKQEQTYRPPKREHPPVTKEEKIKYCQQHPDDINDDFLRGLLVGGLDRYSDLRIAELIDRLDEDEQMIFSEHMGEKSAKVRANTLRWFARGLPIKLAVRKALLDEKLYG